MFVLYGSQGLNCFVNFIEVSLTDFGLFVFLETSLERVMESLKVIGFLLNFVSDLEEFVGLLLEKSLVLLHFAYKFRFLGNTIDRNSCCSCGNACANGTRNCNSTNWA
jgi:hypothetical protein